MVGEPQGLVFFDGLTDVIGGTMTFTRGITPSHCLIRMVAKPQLQGLIGTLRFTYANTQIIFPRCAIDTHSLRMDKRRTGWEWSVKVYDRRWQWQFKAVSGEYNIRMPDDSIKYSTKHPEYRRNARELGATLLAAMGENVYDISALPTDVYPYVNWQGTNPAYELQKLCDLFAIVIVYDWRTDRVILWQLGDGDQLAQLPEQLVPDMRFSVSKRPDSLLLACDATRFQIKFKLEAVGRDTNGDIKKIDDLTYKPSTGWSYDWWCAFPGVDKTKRHQAFDTVFRYYRLKELAKGGLSIPGNSVTIRSIDQFVLEDILVEVAEDIDKMPVRRPAFLQGIFWPQCEWAANTDKDKRYNGKFIIHKDTNIVEFPYPILQISDPSGLYEPAEMYLTCLCKIKLPDGSGYVAASFPWQLPWQPSGAGPRVMRHPELWQYQILDPEDANSQTAKTNDSQLAAEASVYLNYIAHFYQSGPQQDRPYVGIIPYSLDGALASVSWRCGNGMQTRTRVGRCHEADAYTHSYEWRRRFEKIDGLADMANI